MTKRDVLSIALRVLGIFYVLEGALYIPTAVAYRHMPSWPPGMSKVSAVAILAQLVLMWVFGGVMLFRGDRIAARLVSIDSGPLLPSIRGNDPALLAMAVRIIGILSVVQGVPVLAGVLGDYCHNYTFFEWSKVVAAVARVAVGAGFLAWARQIAGFFCGVRADPQELGGPSDE